MKNSIILLSVVLLTFASCTKDSADRFDANTEPSTQVESHFNNGAGFVPIVVNNLDGEYITITIETYECHIPETGIAWGGRGYKAVGSPINILEHAGNECQLFELEFQITSDHAEIDLRFPVTDRSDDWKVDISGEVGDKTFEEIIQD